MPDTPPAPAFIRLLDVSRTHGTGSAQVRALEKMSLDIPEGTFAAITGPSGCGKSTLLNLLGALDHPSTGEVWVDGLPLHNAGETERTTYRRKTVGMVFQFFNLLPGMTVLENVALPLLLQHVTPALATTRATEMLDLTGMSHRLHQPAAALSGGEMQRTAMARALVHQPRLLLADEPTGNLDSENEQNVLALLESIHLQGLCTVVLVTHSPAVAERAALRIRMKDGHLCGQDRE